MRSMFLSGENSLRHALFGLWRQTVIWIVMANALSAWGQGLLPMEIGNQEILRQQERERLLREQQELKPDIRLQESRAPVPLVTYLPASEQPCFTIKRIDLLGDAAELFQWAVKAVEAAEDGAPDSPLGRCLGAKGIGLAMKRIQNAVIERGYVTTRVLAAPQDLHSGTLELTVVPGRVREVRFTSDSDPRANYGNALATEADAILNLRDIEQSLENFKRVPSAEADIRIVPAEISDSGRRGGRPGDSDLLIQWHQGMPFRLSFSADDAGTRATGRYQGNLTLSYDHWWTLNDLFYVSVNHDLGGGDPGNRGTRGYTVHYSLPLGYWLLGITDSLNRYHQSVVGSNQTYLYSGDSQNSDIRLSRLVYRDAVRKTTLSARWWLRSSNNFVDDAEIQVQRRRMAGWEFGVNHREFIGPSTLDVNLSLRQGTGAFSAMPAPEEAFGEGSSRPKIISADFQWQAPFNLTKHSLRYSLVWRAQWNRTPLVPLDRFTIGSRYTVRGFDGENLLSAERGWLIRNDLGWALAKGSQEIYAALDGGELGGATSQTLIGTRLVGGGIGIRGKAKGVNYDFFVSQPLRVPKDYHAAGGLAGFNLNWSL